MRIAFLGNHTVGVRTLETIAETETVVGVVAHPPDPEDGVRYESVYATAERLGLPVVRATGRDPRLVSFLHEAEPELLWLTDYRYLVGPEILALAPLGAVNLHPSLLPAYRGRASINWAILKGERTLGLTAHCVDEGMDSGDVIAPRSYELAEDEDVGDALDKLYPLYRDLTREVLGHFRAGSVPREPQDEAAATTFPARRPEDGRIDWTRPAREVRDLVRAVARPYPGAFTTAHGRKLLVWRATLDAAGAGGAPPGLVTEAGERGPVVACGEGAVELLEVEWEEGGAPTATSLVGTVLA